MVGIQNTFGGIFGAEVCAFGAPPQNRIFLALCISNTPIVGIQKKIGGIFGAEVLFIQFGFEWYAKI